MNNVRCLALAYAEHMIFFTGKYKVHTWHMALLVQILCIYLAYDLTSSFSMYIPGKCHVYTKHIPGIYPSYINYIPDTPDWDKPNKFQVSRSPSMYKCLQGCDGLCCHKVTFDFTTNLYHYARLKPDWSPQIHLSNVISAATKEILLIYYLTAQCSI